MKQSIISSILLLLLSSSSLVTPILARSPTKSSDVATPAPGPSNSDCSSVIFSMMDCITYLSVGSNETKPEKSCCDGIQTVLQYNPQCICYGLVSSSQMGISLNNSRALATPKACKLSISPPHCGVMSPSPTTPSGSVPVTSPVSPSAGSTPKTSPSVGSTPKTSPSVGSTPKTSPSTTKSPETSPSSTESPSMTAPSPSRSGTNNLSVHGRNLISLLGFSIVCISALF